MEKDRSINTNGQEIGAEDWNATTQLASVTQDYVFQELFRPWPFDAAGGIVSKGVIPYGYSGTLTGGVTSNGTDPRQSGIVQTTGSSAPALRVYPFRAIIGSIEGVDAVAPRDAWREARSIVVADQEFGSAVLPLELDLDPTVANNRCDLVYLHVTIAAITKNETRFVRDPITEVLSQPSLDVELGDTFEILVAQSAEAASPSRPSLPADSGQDYYIALAYCYLQHPSPGAVSATLIHEVAPVIALSRATGAATMQPGNQQWNPTGAMLTATPFQVAASPGRPDTYIAPTMTGLESRFFFFKWDGATKSPAVSSDVLIDNSIDWRKRWFEWHAQARKDAGASRPAWSGFGVSKLIPSVPFNGATAGLGTEQAMGFGQGFIVDTLVPFGVANGAAAAVLDPVFMSVLSAICVIYVNQSTGDLRLFTSGDPAANVFIRISASGPFDQPVNGVA